MMTSPERVSAAFEFRRPFRIPRWDAFWEFPDSWRARLGPPEGLTDIDMWIPDETPFPSRVRKLKEEGGWIYEVNGWGQTVRRREGAYFCEYLDVAIPEGTDIDSVEFESPALDARYSHGIEDDAERDRALEAAKQRHFLIGKTGGPYLRTTFLRGEEQFLMDIAGDPPLARALAEKTARHLAAVGTEQIRRWKLQDTGVQLNDDMGTNNGPMMSPASFEKVFLPAYRILIGAYREAGAKYVILHSDGNILPVLEMLVDAGIDGLNPVERRAGMDMGEIRKAFPQLILTGGMCNTDTLVRGTPEQVRAEARQIMDLGRDGGVVIGTHSISPEVPLDNFVAYHEAVLEYDPSLGSAG